jgi:hypothetical protein
MRPKYSPVEPGGSSPRFYVRRDVPMLQQIPPSFFIFRAPNLFGIQWREQWCRFG